MRTQSDIVAAALRDDILNGELAAGLHLEEIPLAARFGVSRTPVRAALSSLASEGLLDYTAKKGYVVRGVDMGGVLHSYEARAALESVAARRAAENGVTAQARSRLLDCLDEGDRLLARARAGRVDAQAWREMNQRFHLAILEAADNPVLAELVVRVQRLPLASLRLFPEWRGARAADYFNRSQLDHRGICDAILARQGSRAAARMEDHVLSAGEILRAEYQRSTQGRAPRRRKPG